MSNEFELKPVIAALCAKGGVGKTTTSVMNSEYAALIKGMKVLHIDLDPQCNSSDSLIGMVKDKNAKGGKKPPKLSIKIPDEYDPESGVEDECSVLDIFYGRPVLPYPSWVNGLEGCKGKIDVICGHPELGNVNNEFNISTMSSDVLFHLRNFLTTPEIHEEYDLIILDTPPTDSPLFRICLRAASFIYTPFEPNPFDIDCLDGTIQHLRQENYSRGNDIEQLEFIGILPNKVDLRRTAHTETLAQMQKNYPDVIFPNSAWLSNLAVFPRVNIFDAQPQSVFQLSKNEKARHQAMAMCEYVHKIVFKE